MKENYEDLFGGEDLPSHEELQANLMLTMIKIIEIIKNMKINLNDKLVEELDSIFDNKRTSQEEWDVCIEDIVEEYIARHNGTWEELPYEEEEENDDVILISIIV